MGCLALPFSLFLLDRSLFVHLTNLFRCLCVFYFLRLSRTSESEQQKKRSLVSVLASLFFIFFLYLLFLEAHLFWFAYYMTCLAGKNCGGGGGRNE